MNRRRGDRPQDGRRRGRADILITDTRSIGWAIQCKRYGLTKSVGISDVREFIGAWYASIEGVGELGAGRRFQSGHPN